MIVRQSQLVGRVLREAPGGLDRLTATGVRGGYFRMGADGLVSLPLGHRTEQRLRSRFEAISPDDGVVEGAGHNLRSLAAVLGKEIRSFRELPVRVRILGSRPGKPVRSLLSGSVELEEGWFVAAADEDSAREALASVRAGLCQLWDKLGLKPLEVAAGGTAVEWIHLADGGPAGVLRCLSCGTDALKGVAGFHRGASSLPETELELVETPGATTIATLCDQVGLTPAETMKALILAGSPGEVVLILLRGDLELSAAKLDALQLGRVRPATEEEIRAAGLVPGYAGPIGIALRHQAEGQGVRVIADTSIDAGGGLVCGANRDGYHFRGATFGRDYDVSEVADLAMAPSGAACPRCQQPMAYCTGMTLARQEVEAGSLAMSAEARMGAGRLANLGISLRAWFAAALDVALRGEGLLWPAVCSPFPVHALDLSGIGDLEASVRSLDASGLDILLDDRDLSPGVKFGDAEWIGAPVWLISGRKAAEQGGLEVRLRPEKGRILSPADAEGAINAHLGGLM